MGIISSSQKKKRWESLVPNLNDCDTKSTVWMDDHEASSDNQLVHSLQGNNSISPLLGNKVGHQSSPHHTPC